MYSSKDTTLGEIIRTTLSEIIGIIVKFYTYHDSDSVKKRQRELMLSLGT